MFVFRDNYCYLKQKDEKEKIIKFPYFLVINRNDENKITTRMHKKYLQGDNDGNLKLWTMNKIEYFSTLKQIRGLNIQYWKPKSIVSQFRIATKDKWQLYPEYYNELNILTIDIETTGLQKEKDSVILIIVHHNKLGLKIFKNKNEKSLLKEFQQWLIDKEIDVINGHNIVNFDLPFLAYRYKLHFKQDLIWSKNGSSLYVSPHKSQFPYRYGRYFYNKCFINNVAITDTMFMVMAYDLIKRECDNYKLKYLEQFFELVDENRVYLTPEEIISSKWNSQKLLKYCEDDVQSTLKLFDMFFPSYYYQLLYFPMGIQDIIFDTIVPKWDSAIVIDYLAQDHSIPLPKKEDSEIDGVKFEGAITGCLKKGLIENVRKIDVASLYPSIIIKHHIKSDKDYLDVAYKKFVKITKDRLWYKARKKENKLYDYIQNALKYIINPYFGYLGNEYSLYSNIEGAGKVAKYGRFYLTKILDIMEKNGATIIEIDTDGVIYSGKKMADIINKHLPKEIQVEDEGFWSKMISYSKKNYILYNGKRDWVKKGVFFKSSSMSVLKKKFVDDFIDCVFEGKSLTQLLNKYYMKITTGQCSVDELKQKFRARMTKEEYLEHLRNNPNVNPQLPYEYFIEKNIDFGVEDVVYLYKAKSGLKYKTMKRVEEFDGVYDIKYYLKQIFDFITKIYKNAPELLDNELREKYDDYRFVFTGVKTRKKKGEKNNEKLER